MQTGNLFTGEINFLHILKVDYLVPEGNWAIAWADLHLTITNEVHQKMTSF